MCCYVANLIQTDVLQIKTPSLVLLEVKLQLCTARPLSQMVRDAVPVAVAPGLSAGTMMLVSGAGYGRERSNRAG